MFSIQEVIQNIIVIESILLAGALWYFQTILDRLIEIKITLFYNYVRKLFYFISLLFFSNILILIISLFFNNIFIIGFGISLAVISISLLFIFLYILTSKDFIFNYYIKILYKDKDKDIDLNAILSDIGSVLNFTLKIDKLFYKISYRRFIEKILDFIFYSNHFNSNHFDYFIFIQETGEMFKNLSKELYYNIFDQNVLFLNRKIFSQVIVDRLMSNNNTKTLKNNIEYYIYIIDSVFEMTDVAGYLYNYFINYRKLLCLNGVGLHDLLMGLVTSYKFSIGDYKINKDFLEINKKSFIEKFINKYKNMICKDELLIVLENSYKVLYNYYEEDSMVIKEIIEYIKSN